MTIDWLSVDSVPALLVDVVTRPKKDDAGLDGVCEVQREEEKAKHDDHARYQVAVERQDLNDDEQCNCQGADRDAEGKEPVSDISLAPIYSKKSTVKDVPRNSDLEM